MSWLNVSAVTPKGCGSFVWQSTHVSLDCADTTADHRRTRNKRNLRACSLLRSFWYLSSNNESHEGPRTNIRACKSMIGRPLLREVAINRHACNVGQCKY